MQIMKLSALVLFFISSLVILTGCADDLQVQNSRQKKQIAELQSELQAARLQLGQMQRQLDTADGRWGVEAEALRQKIAALEEDLAKKKTLIASMQQQLLYGGLQLPAELSTMLEDFAKDQDMVTYDASRGIVKFKSDLLFEKGSDKVEAAAANAVKSLCKILNSEQAKDFDIIIAGHTDILQVGLVYSTGEHAVGYQLFIEKSDIAAIIGFQAVLKKCIGPRMGTYL